MKTLHSIFHRGLPLNFAKIMAFSVSSLLLGVFLTSLSSTSISVKLIGALSIFFSFLCPLALSFVNSSFPLNIRWLINQNFNRKTLITFFFLSQTLKVALALLVYAPLALILSRYKPDNGIMDDIATTNTSIMYADIYLYSALFLFGVYIFYVCSLFSANIAEIKKENSGVEKNMAGFLTTFIVVFLILLLIPFLEEIFPAIPNVIKGYFICFFIAFTSLIIINRTFRFYNEKQFQPLAAAYGSTIILPFIVLTLLMRYQVHDESIPYRDRAESVVHLGWVNKTFTEDQMIGFLGGASERLTYLQLLKMFKGKLDFHKSLSAITKDYQAMAFLSFHAEPQTEDKIRSVIDHISELREQNKWNSHSSFIVYSSRQFFAKQTVGQSYLEELASSEDSYRQLASVYFARNSLNQDEFQAFYETYSPNFTHEVTEDGFVRRSIASRP